MKVSLSSPPFIDAHTHKEKNQENNQESSKESSNEVLKILCLDLIKDAEEIDQLSSGDELPFPFSLGLHPWSVDLISAEDQDLEEVLFKRLEKGLRQKNCLALGEIGLDRARKQNWQEQTKWFDFQMKLAAKWDIPVVILHCVRTYEDILPVIKKYHYKGKLIFHDYNGNPEQTRKLLQGPWPIYFSYGKKLFQEQTHGFQSLPFIPLNHLFLETDDFPVKDIRKIYQRAQEVLGLSEEKLKIQFAENFNHCF